MVLRWLSYVVLAWALMVATVLTNLFIVTVLGYSLE